MKDQASSRVRFTYELLGSGWATATLSEGTQEVVLHVSYLSDALRDLTDAVVALLQGAVRATCSWADEPGEYRWILERQADNLRLTILWFDEAFSRLPDERGKTLFSSVCKLRQFANQLNNQLWRLLTEVGLEGYAELWKNHSFPTESYETLQALASSKQG